MKKYIGTGLVLWTLGSMVLPASGLAEPPQHSLRAHHTWRRWSLQRGEQVPSVPELNPTQGGEALALLLGGIALAVDRSRRRRVAP